MSPIDSVHKVVDLGLGSLHLSGPPWPALEKAEQVVLSLLTWNPPRPTPAILEIVGFLL